MFPGYTSANPTQDQVDIELAGHGGSLVLIRFQGGQWVYRTGQRLQPAHHRRSRPSPSPARRPATRCCRPPTIPTGRTVLGMLNNCGGGITPWGTVLTAEENFDQYFGGRTALTAADPAKAALYARLPATAGESERKWERYYPRFDVSHAPERVRALRLGRGDRSLRSQRPRRRSAPPSGASSTRRRPTRWPRDGRVVVYSGDDARFEYFYKFVSDGPVQPVRPRGQPELLDSGTLYVAKLNADGTGAWLPLVQGTGPLTAANGFPGQAEVLINARGAADKLAATKMDRPEDIEISPVTGKVYVALTNNTARTTVATDPAEVAANPRLVNRWGHILEITEDGGDNAALTFHWEIFMLCGDPALPQGTYFAGFDPTKVSPISCPDNLDFDEAGNLWIATDGAPATTGFADPQRRHLRRADRGAGSRLRAPVPERAQGLRGRQPQAVDRRPHHLRQHPAPR